jgi:hypothetical protein
MPLGSLTRLETAFHFFFKLLMQVDVALDIVEKMCEAGFKPSIHVLQTIIQICEETYDYILV